MNSASELAQSLCARCSVQVTLGTLADRQGALRAQVARGRTTLTASLLTWELQPSSICMKTMQLWLKTTGAVRFVARQAGQSNDLVSHGGNVGILRGSAILERLGFSQCQHG